MYSPTWIEFLSNQREFTTARRRRLDHIPLLERDGSFGSDDLRIFSGMNAEKKENVVPNLNDGAVCNDRRRAAAGQPEIAVTRIRERRE